MIDPALKDLATRYGVNPDKPFFPVNSLRILYFLISDHYTQGNAAVREQIGSLIPKIEAVLAARTQHRQTNKDATPASDWQAIQAPLQDVYAAIKTPETEHAFEQFFFYFVPMQDTLFMNLYEDMTKKQVTGVTLPLLLHARAVDAVIYSAVITQLITQANPAAQAYAPILNQLTLAYQMNDVVDAIVFAREDLAADNFSPFKMIQQITDSPAAAKELINTTLKTLLEQTEQQPFPPELQPQTQLFFRGLTAAVTG